VRENMLIKHGNNMVSDDKSSKTRLLQELKVLRYHVAELERAKVNLRKKDYRQKGGGHSTLSLGTYQS
jgi:hypothetical protein